MCVATSVAQAFSDRVAELGAVNLLDGDTKVNWPILAAFAGVTLLFLVAVGVSKLVGQKEALKLASAREVYLQLGVLARPQVGGWVGGGGGAVRGGGGEW